MLFTVTCSVPFWWFLLVNRKTHANGLFALNNYKTECTKINSQNTTRFSTSCLLHKTTNKTNNLRNFPFYQSNRITSNATTSTKCCTTKSWKPTNTIGTTTLSLNNTTISFSVYRQRQSFHVSLSTTQLVCFLNLTLSPSPSLSLLTLSPYTWTDTQAQHNNTTSSPSIITQPTPPNNASTSHPLFSIHDCRLIVHWPYDDKYKTKTKQ